MARGEVVQRTANGTTIEPYQDGNDVPEWFGTRETEVPDWHVIRPPDTGKVQTHWAKVVMPLRAMAVGFLWLTLYWWRTALALGAVSALVILFIMA